ncbi:hypothetical protein PHYPSEUDO_002794 [Phytophthora pseudosyringae]|uniref:RxLR effector protein n=1 Tax=Phytophthora pseudosyringae TaxID=221518 RepID=A0A8T1V567_9STRA|nr:hypothetical protein PHYPSEUDO_002794 [Phytophthora pseudosyringae]
MKLTTLAVTTLVAVAGVASANGYQPALRALAGPEPAAPNAGAPNAAAAEHNAQHPAAANAPPAVKETPNINMNADDNKKKEWYGGFGWGGPWGGLGMGGLGGWGDWGGFGGWGW